VADCVINIATPPVSDNVRRVYCHFPSAKSSYLTLEDLASRYKPGTKNQARSTWHMDVITDHVGWIFRPLRISFVAAIGTAETSSALLCAPGLAPLLPASGQMSVCSVSRLRKIPDVRHAEQCRRAADSGERIMTTSADAQTDATLPSQSTTACQRQST
jgi:hypothetical protein